MKTLSKTTILILAALIAVEVSAEFLIQKSIDKDSKAHLITAVLLYTGLPFLVYALFKASDSVSVANTIWQAVNIAAVAFIGYVIFKDDLNPLQLLGVVLATCGALLMLTESNDKNWWHASFRKKSK